MGGRGGERIRRGGAASPPGAGIPRDRPIELVDAADYDALRMRVRALEAALALIVRIRPDDGATAWQALQGLARRLLA